MFGTILMLSGLVGTSIAFGSSAMESGKRLFQTSSSQEMEREFPAIKVKNSVDPSGRFRVRDTYRSESTGEFFAEAYSVEDKSLTRLVWAKTKRELEEKIDLAYEQLSDELRKKRKKRYF